MPELIKLRPFKARKSYSFATAESSSDSSDDDNSSNDESRYIYKLQSKPSKRNRMIQSLPIIINTQPTKQKKKRHRKTVQQFLINTQPASPKKTEIFIQQMREPSYMPNIQYMPMSTSLPAIANRKPFVYQRVHTPASVDERPLAIYNPREAPMRRIARVQPPNTRDVHLPRHAKKLVNRFLNGMEHGHGSRYVDGSDSDCSIGDCKVCRQLRSAMDDRSRRSNSETDFYRGDRVVFETQDPHQHKHGHSKQCKVCNLLEKSDIVVSTTKDHSTTSKKKRGKHVHVVESFPSNIKPAVETTTTTTTTTQPKLVDNTTSAAMPTQSSHYPTSYTTYVDSNTGLTYAYNPNWQYNQSGSGMTYDYSSHYNNPAYMQSHPQHQMSNTTAPALTDSAVSSSQQQHVQTTTLVSPNPLVDTGTYTHMPTKRKKRKPTNKTVVVHTSRNPTPPAPEIIIEQQRSPRLPRKLQSTTVLKERTTQTPHTTTTTYIRT